MPFFKVGRWFSSKAPKNQDFDAQILADNKNLVVHQAPAAVGVESTQAVAALVTAIAAVEEEQEEEVTRIPIHFPTKTVRIDDTHVYNAEVIVHSDERNLKSAAKRMPKKSAFASRRKPSTSKATLGTLIIDTSSEGYQSSRNSIQAPCKIFLRVVSNLALTGSATPATSISSSSSIISFKHREVAHGFERKIASLPPPPIRTESNVKISLVHGKDGSRPAFQVTASSTRPVKSSRFTKKRSIKRLRPATAV